MYAGVPYINIIINEKLVFWELNNSPLYIVK